MLHILFSCPDDLHRSVDLHGCFNGILDKICSASPAKAAPQLGHVNCDLIIGKTCELGGRPLGSLGILCGCPQFTTTLLYMGRAVHGLHSGVSQIGYLIDRFQMTVNFLHGLFCIPVISGYYTPFFGQVPEAF